MCSPCVFKFIECWTQWKKTNEKKAHENEEETDFSECGFCLVSFSLYNFLVSVNKLQDFSMKMVYVCSFSVSHIFSCVPVDVVGWLVESCSLHPTPLRSPVFASIASFHNFKWLLLPLFYSSWFTSYCENGNAMMGGRRAGYWITISICVCVCASVLLWCKCWACYDLKIMIRIIIIVFPHFHISLLTDYYDYDYGSGFGFSTLAGGFVCNNFFFIFLSTQYTWNRRLFLYNLCCRRLFLLLLFFFFFFLKTRRFSFMSFLFLTAHWGASLR